MHATNFFSILYLKKGGRLIRGSSIFSSYLGKNWGGRLIRAVDLYASIYGIIHKTKENLLHLYKSLVRPHLEYCLQVWGPYLKKDIDLLEGVQRRATKVILGWDKHCYQERLDLCNLQTFRGSKTKG